MKMIKSTVCTFYPVLELFNMGKSKHLIFCPRQVAGKKRAALTAARVMKL